MRKAGGLEAKGANEGKAKGGGWGARAWLRLSVTSTASVTGSVAAVCHKLALSAGGQVAAVGRHLKSNNH